MVYMEAEKNRIGGGHDDESIRELLNVLDYTSQDGWDEVDKLFLQLPYIENHPEYLELVRKYHESVVRRYEAYLNFLSGLRDQAGELEQQGIDLERLEQVEVALRKRLDNRMGALSSYEQPEPRLLTQLELCAAYNQAAASATGRNIGEEVHTHFENWGLPVDTAGHSSNFLERQIGFQAM
ncbi:hypothetical protein SeMB42_g02834 [Synchytrium endobioticum]|uniref:Uncharacterized protein n=1 Tax=Synchytrium endobioticum TaxID=286115 RepID=A0A507DDA4_9FUNG|nr:hypothetical protein SeMB42_g02834 [Synchytrium endobioticum]